MRETRQTLTGIYRSRLATVAAINGACPAGGCALAMCCASRTRPGVGWLCWIVLVTTGAGWGFLAFGTLR